MNWHNRKFGSFIKPFRSDCAEQGLSTILVVLGLSAILSIVLFTNTMSLRANISHSQNLRAKHQAYHYISSATTAIQALIRSGHLVGPDNIQNGPVAVLSPAQRAANKNAGCGTPVVLSAQDFVTDNWEFRKVNGNQKAHFIFKYCEAKSWTPGVCSEAETVRIKVVFLSSVNHGGLRRFDAEVIASHGGSFNSGKSFNIRKKFAFMVPRIQSGTWQNVSTPWDSFTTSGGYRTYVKNTTEAALKAQYGEWSELLVAADGQLGAHTATARINGIEMYHPVNGSYSNSDDAYVRYYRLGPLAGKWQKRVGNPMPHYAIQTATSPVSWSTFTLSARSSTTMTTPVIWVRRCKVS